MTGSEQQRDRHPDALADLVSGSVEVDREVLAVDDHTWVVHGRIAYDGEVIVAVFASEREAWAALARVAPAVGLPLRGRLH